MFTGIMVKAFKAIAVSSSVHYVSSLLLNLKGTLMEMCMLCMFNINIFLKYLCSCYAVVIGTILGTRTHQ